MAENQVKIVISAEDRATATMNKVAQSFKQYRDSYESIGDFSARQKSEADALSASNTKLASSADAVSSSNRGLFTTFTAASIAANAITGAVSFIANQFKQSVSAANQYQSAMSGLASYATTFGSSTEQATAAVQSLSSNGLLPTVNAANALKNLLASGLNLEEASSLVKTFEDRAAFGRNQTIGFGEAVENLSQAFKTEQSEAGDANGMTENFSQILEVGAAQMGKNVNQLTSLERAHAKLIGIQQLSIATQGDAARYAETAAGGQAKLEYQVKQTQIAFGTALQPAIQMISQSLVDLGQSFDLSGDGMKTAQMFVTTLAFAVANAANVIIGSAQVIVGAFQSIASRSMAPLEAAMKGAFTRIATSAVTYEQKMQDIAKGTADTRIEEAQRSYDQISAQAAKAAAKMAQEVERENRSYADSMKQRAAQFKQSITDMVIAHRDKARSIQADIADENASYNDQVAMRQEQLNEKLGSLEESHQQKVEDITQSITDEKSKGLVVDGVLYAQANQKKLDELTRQMKKETANYQKSVDDAKAKYEEDVTNDAQKHQAKLATLQTSLNEETAILQKHAAEVAAVGEKQKEDDISRLQRTFAEENVRAGAQHQQRLVDIRQQGNEQGSVYAVALADAQKKVIEAKTPEVVAVAKEQGKKMSDSMWEGFKERAESFFTNLPKWIDQKTGAITGLKTILGAPGSIAKFGMDFLTKKLFGFANGGYTGRGDMHQPAGIVHKGEYVIPKSQVDQTTGLPKAGSGGFTINGLTINNNTPNTNGSIMADLGWAISRRIAA